MKNVSVKKLCLAAMLCALAVAGSTISFPVFASRCAPIQHMVNIFCAVFLGPGYAVGTAFCASLLRNMLGLGTIMAFPGSMFGALLAGIVFQKTNSTAGAMIGEVFGTAILGGLCAWPIAVFVLGADAGSVAFYAYVLPFLISTAAGALLSAVLIGALKTVPTLSKANVEND